MIPIKLTVSNFMPYRDNVPPVNFTGVHTASICGDNGSGKSSIIDAMTWALWGKSRARSDDDLVHQGQTAARVEFDFAVGTQVYRVIRKHDRPRSRRTSGQSSLDLLIAGDDGFKPISGDRIGETQAKISDILHMDYETFINSSFLRQGHADEFTVAKPTERKAVLTSILGLSTYDRLEERAKEAANSRNGEAVRLSSTISEIDEELSHKTEYETELARALSQLVDVETLLIDCDSRLRRLRDARELLRAKQQHLTQLEEQIAHTARDLSRWEGQARQHHTRASEYDSLIAKRDSIENGYRMLVSARKLNDDLGRRLHIFTALRERQHQLDGMIEQAGKPLLKEHALAEGKIAELSARRDRLSKLKSDLHQVQDEMSRLSGAETALRDRRQIYQSRMASLRQLEAEKIRTERDILEIGEKLDLLSSQTGASCPLCEQELGPGHIEVIKAKYGEEKRVRSAAVREIQAEAEKCKADLAGLETELARSETRLNQEKASLHGRASLLQREVSEAEEAGTVLERYRTILVGIEERLAIKDYALPEQEACRRLEREIVALDYDAGRHDRVRGELAELEKYEAPKRKLDEADRLVAQERDSAAQAEQAAGELRASLEGCTSRKTVLAADLEGLPGVITGLAQAEDENRELNDLQKTARDTVASVKERLNRCAQLEFVRRDREEQRSVALREEGVYRDLAEAFGKRGVQALLIEMSLPEIEMEANRLLGRMTDNRMHVRFETQRETKKGDVLETLDIYIADELGTRSYEMFSGGEAFRINFAIRIALSKLLARRAGAPLPTLIIDEGFGTQDANGMEKLKEAITSVQDDFEKILVITHIEDFRDAFPVRIDVVKTPAGSTITMN